MADISVHVWLILVKRRTFKIRRKCSKGGFTALKKMVGNTGKCTIFCELALTPFLLKDFFPVSKRF